MCEGWGGRYGVYVCVCRTEGTLSFLFSIKFVTIYAIACAALLYRFFVIYFCFQGDQSVYPERVSGRTGHAQ